MNRRQFLIAGSAGSAAAIARAAEPAIESHVHLFGPSASFPGHANGSAPKPAPVEEYVKFAKVAGITNAVHVSAEPYQNDHRYLEYTLQHAPKGFLKGTVLFDTTLDETPQRLEEIVKRYPGQIVALRLHCTRGRNDAPSTEGPIRDRDITHPNVAKAWKRAGELGVAIQAHIQPYFAPQIEKHAAAFPGTPVILDHFGHAGTGSARRSVNGWTMTKGETGYRNPAEFDMMLRLAKLAHVVLKVSSLQYSSLEPAPHRDLKQYARRAFDAFGPDRMMAGSLGHNEEELKRSTQVFDFHFDFLSSADRAKIRSGTAKRFFRFA